MYTRQDLRALHEGPAVRGREVVLEAQTVLTVLGC